MSWRALCRSARHPSAHTPCELHAMSLGLCANHLTDSGLRTCALRVCPDGRPTREPPIFSDATCVNMRTSASEQGAPWIIVVKAIHRTFSAPTTILAATVLVGGN